MQKNNPGETDFIEAVKKNIIGVYYLKKLFITL